MSRWMVLLLLAPALLGGCGSKAAPKETSVQEVRYLATPPAPIRPCGHEVSPHGQSPYPGARECLWSAYEQGQQAMFATTHYTVEGDPITWTVQLKRPDRIAVSVDTTRDHFGDQKVTDLTCTKLERLVEGERITLKLSGCSGPNPEIML
jgi:hypothetical protein